MIRPLSLLLVVLGLASVAAAGSIVREGVGQADIVIADAPPRMTRLAAEQLQEGIEKISGARLPIVHAPGADRDFHIYVGRSDRTDSFGLADAELKYGAYRIVARDNELFLFGRDRDFAPGEPYLLDNGPRETYRMTPAFLEQWDKLTGREWMYPYTALGRFHNAHLDIWQQDEGGSFQAVCAFLRDLGMRWYLPGELGEVVPAMKTITVRPQDRTVHPDFAMRHANQGGGRRFGQTTAEEALWQLRMGFNHPADLMGDSWQGSLPHGIKFVSTDRRRDEIVKKHPEWFALHGGERNPKKHCLSSQGLFEEMVDFVRFMFDHYDVKMISVMPADGFANICQCELCEGKATPQRGRRGQLSDYAWQFVDRVAREVYKTHPDHYVSCFAYGTYLLPPLTIDKLSPNVVVGICQTRSTFVDPGEKQRYVDEYRRGWWDKLPDGHKHQLLIWDYYFHASHGTGIPAFFPRIIADDLRDLSGKCYGEFVSVTRHMEPGVAALAVQHLNVYVNSRFWWDADQDLGALLDDYYANYYGPARDEMKAFIEYAEANRRELDKDAATLGKALELFEHAQTKVDPDSVYGKRIALIADYMKPLWPLHEQLVLGVGLDRDGNPEAWGGFHDSLDVTLDGKADGDIYRRAYHLLDIVTGDRPNSPPAQISAAWDDRAQALYMRIVCTEPDMNGLNIASTRNGNTNIFMGDLVEIHLETQAHAYYQLVVNPAGELVSIDRGDGKIEYEWSSGAEAAADRGDNYWAVELRIPVLNPDEQALEPDGNGIAGYRPTRQSPWWINVCRQRVRGDHTELTAMSPTGKQKFHAREAFGRFYVGGKRPGVIRALQRREEQANEMEEAQSP